MMSSQSRKGVRKKFLWNRNAMVWTILHPTACKVHPLLSSCSEKWTSVVHSYDLLLERKMPTVASHMKTLNLSRTIWAKSFVCAVRSRIFRESWKFDLNSIRKLLKYRLEGSCCFLLHYFSWLQAATCKKSMGNGNEPQLSSPSFWKWLEQQWNVPITGIWEKKSARK